MNEFFRKLKDNEIIVKSRSFGSLIENNSRKYSDGRCHIKSHFLRKPRRDGQQETFINNRPKVCYTDGRYCQKTRLHIPLISEKNRTREPSYATVLSSCSHFDYDTQIDFSGFANSYSLEFRPSDSDRTVHDTSTWMCQRQLYPIVFADLLPGIIRFLYRTDVDHSLASWDMCTCALLVIKFLTSERNN